MKSIIGVGLALYFLLKGKEKEIPVDVVVVPMLKKPKAVKKDIEVGQETGGNMPRIYNGGCSRVDSSLKSSRPSRQL